MIGFIDHAELNPLSEPTPGLIKSFQDRHGPTFTFSSVRDAESIGGRLFSPHKLHVSSEHPREELHARVNVYNVGEIQLILMSYGRDMTVEAIEPLSYYSIHLPIAGFGRVNFQNSHVDVSTQRAAIFCPGDVPTMAWAEGLVQIALKIPTAVLIKYLERLTGRSIRNTAFDIPRALDADACGFQGVLQFVANTLLKRDHTTLPPVIAGQLEQMLLSGLLLSQPHNFSFEVHRPQQSMVSHAVLRAKKIFEADIDRKWTIQDLSLETGVSARALQEGFKRDTGISPLSYLRHLRLQRAYNLIKDSASPFNITELAMRSGYSNVGRFSSAFKNSFGVYPSELMKLR